MSSSRRSARALALGAALVIGSVGAACSDDDAGGTSDNRPAPSGASGPSTVASTTPASGGGNEGTQTGEPGGGVIDGDGGTGSDAGSESGPEPAP